MNPFVFPANLHLRASLNSNLTFHAHLTPAVGKFARQTFTHPYTDENFSRKPFHFVNSFAAGSVAGPQLFCLEYIINNRPGTVKGAEKRGEGGNEYKVCKYIYYTDVCMCNRRSLARQLRLCEAYSSSKCLRGH